MKIQFNQIRSVTKKFKNKKKKITKKPEYACRHATHTHEIIIIFQEIKKNIECEVLEFKINKKRVNITQVNLSNVLPWS